MVEAAGDRPLALLLTGGGARAAYQVGVLEALAEIRPRLQIPILTGVSAGGINAAWLASSSQDLAVCVRHLSDLWLSLSPDQVFQVDAPSLFSGAMRWAMRLVSGGSGLAPRTRGLVDTTPLRRLLQRALEIEGDHIPGIGRNIASGRLRAVAVSTVDYGTGRTIIWIEGTDVVGWERPYRRSVTTRLGVDHVMASAALPLLFPAVPIDGAWYGDGGIRLTSPLSPAIHLGARRIVAISTRHRPAAGEEPDSSVDDYPPPAQVAGVLMNAIFLDLLDQDARHLERTNRLLAESPVPLDGLQHLDLVTLRPSRDLGRLARDYESQLPRAFRFLTRGLGTRETRDSDLLSMLMFQRDYIDRLIDLGRRDGLAQREDLEALIGEADG
ncbi:MAG: patatin-like phospholipase family protein [Thermoanaerobaculia bacterium]|nr:patatin-like phospholipase family protein [Thermoanaerobaculia bacterium]